MSFILLCKIFKYTITENRAESDNISLQGKDCTIFQAHKKMASTIVNQKLSH